MQLETRGCLRKRVNRSVGGMEGKGMKGNWEDDCVALSLKARNMFTGVEKGGKRDIVGKETCLQKKPIRVYWIIVNVGLY